MIEIIQSVLSILYNLLPNSYISQFLNESPFSDDILGYLNWFVPFDIAQKMVITWMGCMVSYYVYQMIRSGVFNRILDKIFS